MQDVSTAYGRTLIGDQLSHFDLIFSAGPYCRTAFHIRRLLNQDIAFPFDWLMTPAVSLANMLHPNYQFELNLGDLHLTHSRQAILNSRDLVLHIHDFKRSSNGDIDPESIGQQIMEVNQKYQYLFDRLKKRLHDANRCLIIFEGLLPSEILESYRQRTDCVPLHYPELPPDFADELYYLMKESYNVETTLVNFAIGQPTISLSKGIIEICAPNLSSVFDHDAEPYQRPWASYDMLFAMLCAVLAENVTN